MPEQNPHHYLRFEDYASAVVREAWLKIIAEDYRIAQAATLLLFDSSDNDRSIEANIVANVAQEHNLEPEDMQKVLEIHKDIVVNGYE